MKSSILVPVILIVCLLALALLISQAFTATRDTKSQDTNTLGAKPNASGTDSATFYDIQAAGETDDEHMFEELSPATEADSSNSSPENAAFSEEGRFLVIAGTFRQVINARARVNDLKRAGFSATEMAKFDRGTYAVALVGRSHDYAEANQMAERVRTAGFEARVYRKR
ncbi:hypothetical protein GGR28_002264 [Lewinella aquimaris]|uniref:SPOR domain-containing protein n=1 Tax=Neolewinella aquimaris TaxID=1835722 RepID=A0A840ECW2_9BACT|nr:SPOR domain-containing protein [Neolewinella aquimaris]MBB4079639.1 hypothetical protein [Neolewinella aquimaris]